MLQSLSSELFAKPSSLRHVRLIILFLFSRFPKAPRLRFALALICLVSDGFDSFSLLIEFAILTILYANVIV